MFWEGMNRRRFLRATFPCLVKISVNGSVLDTILTHTENISTGGICVIMKKGLERTTPVDIEIDLMDGEEHILCKGRAMWIERRKATDPLKPSGYDTGIEFLDITREAVQRIRHVVDYVMRNETPENP